MKIQKSNNPLAVGALLCVLTLIIGRTVWLVTRGDGQAQMVTAVPTAPPTVRAAPSRPPTPDVHPLRAPAPDGPAAAAPRSARNPFAVRVARPAVLPIPAMGVGETNAAAPPKESAAGEADVTEVRPLPPLPVGPLPIIRPARRAAQTAALSVPAPEPDPMLNIHLTAIVDGSRRMAVLQTMDPQPVVVHEGDTVLGLLVAAIHDHEVVFTRGEKSWTLPLQTADTAVTVSPNEAAPIAQENSDAPH